MTAAPPTINPHTADTSPVVGIDLGTTNSLVAVCDGAETCGTSTGEAVMWGGVFEDSRFAVRVVGIINLLSKLSGCETSWIPATRASLG